MKFGLILSLLVVFVLCSCGGGAENLKEGTSAPNFSLPDAKGINYTLSSYRGKSPVVVYFYPKASTPGCTKEACGIRDSFAKFEQEGITILGISVDSKEKIGTFIQEQHLNFPLLSDETKEVSKRYGVLNSLGFDNRITFIVDKEGRIANIIRNVDVETHAEQVYQLASKLK